MKKNTAYSYVYFVIIGIAVAMFGGWCANIYKIITSGFEISQWGGMEIARVVGIFVAPLGGVLGWF